jgi:hypothetical protein
MVFAAEKFRGVVHRTLPGIGFIKPDDLAGVEKFFEVNGGKWRKADSRELFFHGSHVVGAEVRKGDTVGFTLSADPNRQFGERTVQAREITGGSGSKVEVKLDQLEKATLADRAVMEGLAEKVREQQETIESLMKYAVKVGVLEQTQKVLEDHVVSNAQKLKAMEEAMTNTLTESISLGMDRAMEKFQKKLLSGVSNQPEVGSVACESHSLSTGSPSEAEISTEEPESSEEEPQEKKPKKSKSSRGNGKKIGNTYNFAPSAFQAFKSNLGLGVLMMLAVIFGQVSAFGYRFGCEARVVRGLGGHPVVGSKFSQEKCHRAVSVLVPDESAAGGKFNQKEQMLGGNNDYLESNVDFLNADSGDVSVDEDVFLCNNFSFSDVFLNKIWFSGDDGFSWAGTLRGTER